MFLLPLTAAVLMLAGCSNDDSVGDESLRVLADEGDGGSEESSAGGDGGSGAAEQIDTDGSDTESGDGSNGAEGGEQSGDSQQAPGPAVEPPAIAEAVGPVLQETGEDLTGQELEQYLARRYKAYWEAFDLARQAPSATPDATYPELFALAAGEQLELAHSELKELHRSGHAIRDPQSPAIDGLDMSSRHRLRIEQVEGGVAELVGCLVNDQVRYSIADGTIINDAVLTVASRTTMAFADGSWKIIGSEATALDSGVSGCWLEPESSYPY